MRKPEDVIINGKTLKPKLIKLAKTFHRNDVYKRFLEEKEESK